MSKNTNLSFLTDYITADITNGRIGINNASPTVAFDVVGAGKFSGVTTVKSCSIVSTNGYSGQIIQQGDIFGTSATNLLIQSSTSNGIGFLTNGGTTFNMFINSTGNVGIGTTSPDERLTIGAGNGISIRTGNTGIYGSLKFGTNNSSFYNEWAGIDSDWEGQGANVANLRFYTSFGARGERMRITGGGNVGIGTSSPNGKLSVQDAVYGEYLRVLSGVVAGNQTSVYLAWNNGGNITLQQIVVGAADSGGSGFRVLRIPNT